MQAESRSPSLPEDVGLQVSPRCYVNTWYFVLALRATCWVFLGVTAFIYFFLAQPELAYYAALLGPSAQSGLKPVGVAFGCLAAAHCYDLFTMLWYSLQYDKRVFARDPNESQDQSLLQWLAAGCPTGRHKVRQKPSRCSLHSKHSSVPDTEALELSDEDSRLTRASKQLQRWYWQLYGRRGLFGVESKYFELNYAAREVSEVASQTFQAYWSSLLVASPKINTLYVTMIVLNCWSSPIVTHLCRRADANVRRARRVHAITRRLNSQIRLSDEYLNAKARALERVCCLCTELLLDVGAATLVPTLIVAPYVRVFDMATATFPDTLLYDDVWFIGLVLSAQQLFAYTPLDFVFTMAPHVGIYFGLSSLVSLADFRAPSSARKPSKSCSSAECVKCKARRAKPAHTQLQRSAPATAAPHGDSTTTSTSASAGPTHDLVLRPNPLSVSFARTAEPRIDSTVKKLLHGVFVFWGVVILLLHAASFLSFTELRHSVGCKQRVWPWLAFALPCVVFEYNCFRHNTSTVPAHAFEGLELDVLSALLITHCPALVVPPSIRAFPHLLGLEIYNSTIVEWSDVAAITEVSHREMKYVVIARTNMTHFPDGLTRRLPRGLNDVEIALSNLSALPHDLDARWDHPLSILLLEQCELETFPDALTRLRVKDLSLYGNRMQSMKSVQFTGALAKRSTLVFAAMPLHELPDAMPSSVRDVEFVSLEHTHVAALPSWVHDAAMHRTTTTVFALGTPFCTLQSAQVIATSYDEHAAISCVKQSAFAHGRFPLALMAQQRALRASE